MRTTRIAIVILFSCFSQLHGAEAPYDCLDLQKRSPIQSELCRVYRNNENCLILSHHSERAICEAYRDRNCQSLSASHAKSYAYCKVYLNFETCGLYLNDFDQSVCQAHREGLCEKYTGHQRKECQTLYSIPTLMIHQTVYTKLIYDFERRGPYLLLPEFARARK